MDFLIEFLVELFLEGCIELGTNRKVPAMIRYPLLLLICLVLFLVLGGIFFLVFVAWKENIALSIVLIIIGLVFIFGFGMKVRYIYCKKRKDPI